MPVVLPPESYAAWLDPETTGESVIDLLAPAPNDLLEAVPLDKAVNSIRADGPEVLTPAGPAEVWAGA
jgi:putative SOS response-associated peptidase YedK